MSDAKCPHCNKEFDVNDHYESGEYDCPYCEKTLWIKVDHVAVYEATCLENDHEWERPGEPWPDGLLCTKCNRFKMDPRKSE